MKTYHHLNLGINNKMDNLEKIVDVKMPIKPNLEVEQARCCTCCITSNSKKTDLNNRKCCECCTKIIKHTKKNRR